MARLVAKIEHFATLFKNSDLPLFVLDEQRRIVLWNQGCVAWTGVPAGAMLGQACVHQAPDGHIATGPLSAENFLAPGSPAAGAVAAGLCPPPDVFSGCRRRVRRGVAVHGRILDRWVEYVPLGPGGEGRASVLALVDPLDASDEDQPAALGSQEAGPEELHRQLVQFRRHFARRFVPEQFVGIDPSIVRAREQAALAANSKVHVLIIGPPGSGKEHLARSIHYARWPDGSALLIPLDCAALGGELLWSTIRAVGETAGESVGETHATRQGQPRTLVLNDVDQLPFEVQQPLAEALAAKKLGIHVIGTCTRSLDAAALEGEFRPDLACMLGTLVIHLPALAQRLGDLPLLAQALLEEVNAAGKKQVAGFTPEALDALAGFGWPGNIDELAKVVAEAHGLAAGPEIGPRDLPKRLHFAAQAARRTPRPAEPIVLEEVLKQLERDLIEQALRRARGNKSRASKLLGLTRPRLYRRMVQLGLEPPAGEAPAHE